MRAISTAWVAIALFAVTCSHRPPPLEALVSGIGGHALIQHGDNDRWIALDTGNVVGIGDSVRVLSDSYLELVFGEGNRIRLCENTDVHFDAVVDSQGRNGIEVFNHRGSVVSNIASLPKTYALYQVRTPDAVAVAGGTHFCVTYEVRTRNAEIVVVSGEVWVVGPEEQPEPVAVETGHYVVIPRGMPPSRPARLGLLHRRRVERLVSPPIPMRRIARFAPSPKKHRRPKKRIANKPVRPGFRPGGPGPRKRGPGIAKKPRKVGPKRAVKPAAPRKRKPGPAAQPSPRRKAKPAARPAPRRKPKPALRRGPGKPRGAAVRPRGRKAPGPAAKGKGKKPNKDERGKGRGPGRRR